MSSHAAARSRPRARRARARPAPPARVLAVAAACSGVGVGGAWCRGVGPLGRGRARDHAPAAPRRHHPPAGADKNLDPALIAAVIYEESSFRDQTSHAGARGLMQITPETADFIATPLRRRPLQAGGPRHAADQHLLRRLVPALPDRPLRRQRDARDRGLQRGAGQRRPLGAATRAAAETSTARPHPVPGDARVRGERDEAPPASTGSNYAHDLGL